MMRLKKSKHDKREKRFASTNIQCIKAADIVSERNNGGDE